MMNRLLLAVVRCMFPHHHCAIVGIYIVYVHVHEYMLYMYMSM